MGQDISVMVQDRSSFFRDALALLLSAEPGVSVRAQVTTADELLERAIEAPPDTVFLEIRPTPWNVLTVLDRLSGLQPQIRLVGIGRPSDGRHYSRLDHGPLPRTAPFEDFLRATGIHDPREPLTSRPSETTRSETAGLLTELELLVLSLLGAGRTNAQIAERLQLSHRSIRSARERLLLKLDAQSTAEVVAAGIRDGLLSPPAAP